MSLLSHETPSPSHASLRTGPLKRACDGRCRGCACALAALLCVARPVSAATEHRRANGGTAAPTAAERVDVAALSVPVAGTDGHPYDDDIDSEHIFGFTHGSDIGARGEWELELEPAAAMGFRSGTYVATTQVVHLKYTVTDNLRLSPGLFTTTHNIQDVGGLEDRSQAELAGAVLEVRYRLLDRQTAPIGLTATFDPVWNRVDALTGEPVEQYGAELAVFGDKDIVPDRLFAAINVAYVLGVSRSRSSDVWGDDCALGIDTALSHQLMRGVFVGAEVRFGQQYDGMGFGRFRGDVLYVGPTFFVQLTPNTAVSGAWGFKAAGNSVHEPGASDLDDPERHQVLLRFNALLNP